MKSLRCYNYKNSKQRHYHKHNSIEISYLLSGKWEFVIDDLKIPMKKGDAIILSSRNNHKYQGATNNTACVGFEFDIIKENEELLNILNYKEGCDFKHKIITNNIFLAPIFLDIFEKLHSKDTLDYVNHAVKYILSYIANYKNNDLTQLIINYLMENFIRECSLDDLANNFCFSKVHIQRVFKRDTGVTIGNFLNSIRMKQAHYLLTNSVMPIGNIGYSVGINSRQSFYIAFKKMYGISPHKVRAECNK